MAKSKRKISSTQRDKVAIARAKALKAAGILSKQTKLHGGKYISRGVLNKVREYEASADLGYKAYTVSKETARAAKERGFQVVQGNRIIGPKTPTFRNRLNAGELTGVRPVKGGMMEEVILPHSVYDMRSLVNQLEQGIDTLKLPNEQFAFRYHGNESYRAFMNSEQLLAYMRHYKSFVGINSMRPEDMVEEFQAFSIFRLHPNTVPQNIRGPQRRVADRKRERMEAIARGEYVGQPRKRSGKSRAEKLAEMHPNRRMRELLKDKLKAERKRAAIAADPARDREYKEKARKRSKEWRDKRKGK